MVLSPDKGGDINYEAKVCRPAPNEGINDKPVEIDIYQTGLVTKPKMCHSEGDGQEPITRLDTAKTRRMQEEAPQTHIIVLVGLTKLVFLDYNDDDTQEKHISRGGSTEVFPVINIIKDEMRKKAKTVTFLMRNPSSKEEFELFKHENCTLYSNPDKNN